MTISSVLNIQKHVVYLKSVISALLQPFIAANPAIIYPLSVYIHFLITSQVDIPRNVLYN